ncbi:hypothetical protein L198_06084 [Cryptococcus wingfieldii CBS 7118]|uniref:Uncharacterized protein n=1 Tax=Cryptococcus wingfieldii CBS 7118 TaxID=1295528 RepID=A0A1E3IQF7_9TREE|nr:hypothetical protein L198_06084 [Cryptococcus wingfieldii CBS 7118]ODN90768.1 hypothetical protein L198_06084 [Cryptococcus wingfieldii CBS 7118]
MDTTAPSPSFYQHNYASTPQQHQPYPSPLPTHVNAPHRTPLSIHRRPPPVHYLHQTPNGSSPQLPMTPPYAAFQYPPNSIPPTTHQTSPQTPAGSEPLPSNHIHVIRTTPQAQPPQVAMFRSNSTMSTTSTNRPPALSNGPSPTGGEEVIADMSEQSYEGFPPGTSQQHARMVQQQQQSQRGEQVPVGPGEPQSAPGRWQMAPGQQAAHLWQRMLTGIITSLQLYSLRPCSMEYLLHSPLSPIPTAQLMASYSFSAVSPPRTPSKHASPDTGADAQTQLDSLLESLPLQPTSASPDDLLNALDCIARESSGVQAHPSQEPLPQLEGGAGLRVIVNFIEALGQMQGDDLNQWTSFILHNFEDSARFQFVVTGSTTHLYDIPAHYLPRFFLTLPCIPHILFTDPIESSFDPPSSYERTILCSDMEWKILEKKWKGAFSAVVGRGRRMERMEVVLREGEDGPFPEAGLRVLRVAQEMESFALIMRLQQEENLAPKDALARFTLPEEQEEQAPDDS